MKNVLFACVLFAISLISACGVPADFDASVTPSTATLQPFPTFTQTATAPVQSDQSTQLVASDPSATPFVHVVREGDTLLSIAIRYGVGLEELVLVNPGVDPQFLSVGTSLRIPGPEGEAVDALLPTPTPVPLDLSQVRCFEDLSGTLRCLAAITNASAFDIEAISAIIGLYSEQGELLDQKSTENTLRFLPAGERVPLVSVFTEKPPEFGYADIQVLSAITVDAEVSRFVPVDVSSLQSDNVGDGAGALLKVQVAIPEDIEPGDYLLRILGFAMDHGDEIVGHRLIEQVLSGDSPDVIEFEFYILSLGPKVNAVDALAELLRIN